LVRRPDLGSARQQQADVPAVEVNLGDLAALRGVVKFPVRIKCATLSWNTLNQGLDEIDLTLQHEQAIATYEAGR
jgi:NifU-like protein involved in Fe-S cluster formation